VWWTKLATRHVKYTLSYRRPIVWDYGVLGLTECALQVQRPNPASSVPI